MTSQIEILFVSANAPSPILRQRIRPEEEYRDIRRGLQAGKQARLFKLLPPLFATRIDDLHEGLSYHRPHVVHFAGHAGPSGIELENEHGLVVKVDIQSLTCLFEAVNRPVFDSGGGRVKLVVLHACSTVGHAEALTAAADFAIGTPADVWDEDSINFAPAFYNSLANGHSLEAALASASVITKTKNYLSNHALKLFSRPDADPNLPFITHVRSSLTADSMLPPTFDHSPDPPHGRQRQAQTSQPAKKVRKVWAPGKSADRLRQYVKEDEALEKEREEALAKRRKKR